MNNKEFLSSLASKLELSAAETETIGRVTVDVLIAELQKNKTVNMQGFGAFDVRKKAERVSFNPATGKRSITPPKLVLNFRTSNAYKEKIKELPQPEKD